MSKINDLLIQAEEAPDNDQRIAWYYKKIKQYRKYLYPTRHDWFADQDNDDNWIKEKQRELNGSTSTKA